MLRFGRSFSLKKDELRRFLQTSSGERAFFSLPSLRDPRVGTLPFSIRVLLENALRNLDEYVFTSKTVESILDWRKNATASIEVPFKPSRVILQDFTGVPAVADLAAMRDAVQQLGSDPRHINPLCPVDLVVDHSVQVDVSGDPDAKRRNEELEFRRNYERFQFLKWGQKAFENLRIIPPGSGIVHQVNLEYLAKVVFDLKGTLYPDSVVGTDSHTTMINALGVVGWGVGGIEAEAVMLGQHLSLVLPEVVGVRLYNHLRPTVFATDLVLTLTELLRKRGVVGKFVEFFGEGVGALSVEDRATIANMAPEYGATVGFFPVDERALSYLEKTGRAGAEVEKVHAYLRENMLLREYSKSDTDGVQWSGNVLELDLAKVEPCLAGPKRPQDRVNLSNVRQEFLASLTHPVGFKGFDVKPQEATAKATLQFKGKDYELQHGSVMIAAITSCTNTSNPEVLIGAALLARNAVERGLTVQPYIKTSLSPGSGVVEEYFRKAGLLEGLQRLGFYVTGLGCMTCIGNSGDLFPEVAEALKARPDLVVAAVLSGNRNFEGRVHPQTRANYLASPVLVVAYALAGKMDFDFEATPLGVSPSGQPVFLRDIWPDKDEIRKAVKASITRDLFQDVYQNLDSANESWNKLEASSALNYPWDSKSTYIHRPPFFEGLGGGQAAVPDIAGARVLLHFGDSITTDHISPAGKIASNSPAARYLTQRGVTPTDFNTYGSRRGNDEVMVRGTFANIRLINKLVQKPGPTTVHVPSSSEGAVFDIAERYRAEGTPVIILAGNEYGAGSSRDWAAKGPYLLGVKAVIAQSYERIHRSNLVGMGVLPLQFLPNQNPATLGLDARDTFNIPMLGGDIKVHQEITVTTGSGKTFSAIARLDTPIEIEYFKQGGILRYVLRQLVASHKTL